MRLIESEDKTASAYLSRLLPHTGKSHVIGITGLPGAGKSSIIDKLIDFQSLLKARLQEVQMY